LKGTFWLVKFLEDVGYDGPRHFDAHAYRTEDCAGVKDFARGCMRTYLIMKEKAERWNADKEIQALLHELSRDGKQLPSTGKYSKKSAEALLAHSFDKDAILRKRLPYERLDQMTVDILTGVR
jgi:xylose isomerase